MKTAQSIWQELKTLSQSEAAKEPVLANDLAAILESGSLAQAVTRVVTSRLNWWELEKILPANLLQDDLVAQDIRAILDNDPAVKSVVTPVLYFKGFHALQAYRLAHRLWLDNRRLLAEAIQSRVSLFFGVDIHPAAKIGRGIMMDHATGIVIGETAVVGDHVLFWHGVTLGGKSSSDTDRHPKVGNNVILGAGALLLGNIKIGDGAKIGAGAIVVTDVAPGATVVSAKSV